VACAGLASVAAGREDRSWAVTVSPAPGEVSLVQIRFPHAGSGRVSAASLEVSAPRVFGSDYLAAAVLRPSLGRDSALVLVANRPSPLLDPVHVSLAVRAKGALGPPSVLSVGDLFARTNSAPRPRLCDLTLHGASLTAAGLTLLGGAGARLRAVDGTEALAQAYDLACGLPNAGTLRGALSSPVGGGCTPCDPRPGFACPLIKASTAICAEPLS
jgi:hypothetical protein